MRKLKLYSVVMIILLLALALIGCEQQNKNEQKQKPKSDQAVMSEVDVNENTDLVEDKSVYLNDKEDELIDVFITVKKSTKFDMPYTFDDVNGYNYAKINGQEKNPSVEIVFQEGSPNGPQKDLFGFGETDPNAVLEARGHSTSESSLKSFKIKLYKDAGLWDGFRTINLNKHPYDSTRARNKLSFDIMKTLPDFTSLRTRFVHLHIKDTSKGDENAKFVDFGLFTQVEQPNKSFLSSRGLDPDGYLYKAQNFEFLRYKDILRNTDDPLYKKSDFESIMEIKGREDHKKLLSMLDDINNYSININEVVDKHFNRNNYLTWLAVNILMDNVDTNSQNFYLYSPTNSDTWYFMPWDYDGSWGFYEQTGKASKRVPWRTGLSNYWGTVLHKRFIQDPENVKAISEKLESIKKHINQQKTTELLDSYSNIISKFVNKSPDKYALSGTIEESRKEYKRIATLPEKNLEKYYKNLKKPMPFFMGEPVNKGGKITFTWDMSFDLQGEDLTYDFRISKLPDFSKVVVKKSGLKVPEIKIDRLPKGTYYWKVIVKDSKGNAQISFDSYRDQVEGTWFHGVKSITIK